MTVLLKFLNGSTFFQRDRTASSKRAIIAVR